MAISRLGYALGHSHAAAYAGKGAATVLGVTAGIASLALVAAGGALLIAGIASLVTSDKKKQKAE